MAEDYNTSGFRLFGFEIKRAKENTNSKKLQSIVPKVDDDGAGYVTAAGSHYGQYLNMDGDDSKDNNQLVMKYRGVSMHPEVDMAIEDIVNESITGSELQSSIDINLDQIEGTTDSIKKQMKEEFENVVSMLNFTELGHDIFRRWYVDGRIYYHLVVNEDNLKLGIQEIRPIDAAKVRKVKQVKKKKDPETGASLVEKVNEFFVYQEKPGGYNAQGIKLSPDSVCYVTSGLLSEDKKKVVSFLHKALKPINQLRMMEDSLVIYRLARAPERRIFYIDVGNLPRGKAEQYMKDIMARYRNKLVYDAKTGDIRDDRKHMSMLEDFWLPRREGGRGTQIDTLAGGENLGQIDDIIYFQKRLYRSLNVPINRLEQEAEFSLGRSSEISRDELKFQKFIDRLRKRFSKLFLEILKKQLILKGIITEEDWNSWKNDIIVDYIRDNHFTELKDAEMLRERIQTLETMKNAELISTYFSKQWVMKNVLRMTDDDIEDMKKQLEDEQRGGESETEEEPQEESKIQDISLESQDEFVDELEEERKILEIQTKEKELQVLENVAKSLASG
tara:strand:- start:1785 stop:3461 length:1677 start_codon:yes stop_codon:yes gene_type:complete